MNAFARLLAFVTFLFATIAATPAQPIQPGDIPPIRVSSCLVGTHQNLVHRTGLINAALLVNFQISGRQTYKRIVWRVRYGNGWIDFNDNGTFSPGVHILNAMYLLNSAFPSPLPFTDYQNTGDPTDCQIVLTEADDGTMWKRLAPNEGQVSIPNPLLHQEDLPTPAGRRITFESLGLSWLDGTMPGLPVQPPDAPPIHIHSCLVGSRKDLVLKSGGLINAAMLVDFTSNAPKTYTRIVWRARYGHGWIDFNDVGTFSPGTDILNALWIRNSGTIFNPMFPFVKYQNGGEAEDCVVVFAETADGTIWSRLAPNEMPFFITYPVGDENLTPSGIGFNFIGLQWADGTMPIDP
ncbi:MAG: hypothetical protein ACYDGM_04015 [Vulcanimicrobiaceae bacterium]